MGTLGQKLDYLTDTKSILKQKINNLGGSLTDESTFRSYGDYLDELYDEMPKVTGEGTEITLTPTRKGRMQLDLKGNTSQDSYTGKNLIPNNLTNQTINGIAFVVNSDGSVTINGTASATIQINLLTNTIGEADEITLPAGTYTLQGCPTGGSSSTYKLDITNNGSAVITDYGNNVYSRTFTDSWVFDRVRIVVQSGTTINNLTFKPMLVEGNTNVPYEPYTGGVPSPNPDYPQDIHVVTGNNTIEVQGKNLFDKDNYNIKSLNAGGGGTFASASNQKHIYIQCKPNTDYVVVKNVSNIPVLGIYETKNEPAVGVAYTSFYYSSNSDGKKHVTTSATAQYLDVRINTDAITQAEIDAIVSTLIIAEGTDINMPYQPYYHKDFAIDLGDTELCKIGDYQDYLYKENGNWYKYGNIDKIILDGTEYWTVDRKRYRSGNIIQAKTFTTFDEITPLAYSKYFKWGNGVSGTFVEGAFWYTSNGKDLSMQKDENPTDTTLEDFKEWLSTHNTPIYYALQTPTSTQITDENLIAQLDAIENAMSTIDATTITQTNSDLPFIINASALKPFTTETLLTSLTDDE